MINPKETLLSVKRLTEKEYMINFYIQYRRKLKMKKIFIYCCFCFLGIAFGANARISNEFLCNSYKNIERFTKEDFSEKHIFLDDYLTYLNGGDYLMPWTSLYIDEKTIFNISLEQLKQLGKHLTEEKDKQNFQKMEASFPKLLNYMKDNKNVNQAKTHLLSEFVLYTEKHCSWDIKDRVAPLRQKVIDGEKKLFFQKTNGKKLHYKTLEYFTLTNQQTQPSEQFFYEYKAEYNPAVPAIRLRVLQVTPSGVLIHAEDKANSYLQSVYGTLADKFIFIETKEDYVDKDLLRSGFYEYIGRKSYGSILGDRTIHSFREIPNPFKGLHFYNGEE